MIKKKSPKVIWDKFSELKAVIQSYTAHGVNSLKGKVPDTMATGKRGGISDLAEFEWYLWVMFCDTVVSFYQSP